MGCLWQNLCFILVEKVQGLPQRVAESSFLGCKQSQSAVYMKRDNADMFCAVAVIGNGEL